MCLAMKSDHLIEEREVEDGHWLASYLVLIKTVK